MDDQGAEAHRRGVNRLARAAAAALLGVLAAGGAACGTAGAAADDWSRSYLLPEPAVFEAVVGVLEDQGYLVEADREAGRVRAEPGSGSPGALPTLVVEIRRRGDRVLVDVQSRGTHGDARMAGPRVERAIREILHGLDGRLQGEGAASG
jgi:hypothetical protein